MKLDPGVCYDALAARDPRFDGVFFVGVTSTRIYCRPVCRARLPRRDRCTFHVSAASAEADGFRPCLRCRPERAPGRSLTDATARLGRAAGARISAGAMNDGDLPALAKSLHTSERQLRRAVRQEFGASPVQLAQTRRLLLARQLLAESSLSITEVAFASGFGSLRRFNALVRDRYRMTPGELRRDGRRAARGSDSTTSLRLTLEYRPPLAWQPLVGFLAGRATAGVEHVADGAYTRSLVVGEHRGWIRVAPGDGDALTLDVSHSLVPALLPVLDRVRRLFDLDAEPGLIDAHLSRSRALRPLVRRTPGLRVPGAVDGFELAVRAILGQRVSVAAATTLAGRLAAEFGEAAAPDELPPELTHYPVSAAALADASVDRVAGLGITGTRAAALIRLGREVDAGRIALEPGAPVDETIAALVELPGIGPWTAQYVALRALHWPDAFPDADLILCRNAGNLTPAALRAAAEAWRPWRGYAAMHLWRKT